VAFAIRYSAFNRVFFAMLGLGPGASGVSLDGEAVGVRMGWAFRSSFPRSAVRSAVRESGFVPAWGVHAGRGGVWLVNGSLGGRVRVELEPPQQARVCGFGVTLRSLRVSLEEPDAFIAELLG
jgi:hypothetical protein